MKMGVCIVPWSVVRRPARAALPESVCCSSKRRPSVRHVGRS